MKKGLVATLCGAALIMPILSAGNASSKQFVARMCKGKETGEVLNFSSVLGSKKVAMGLKILKPEGAQGNYKMKGHGRHFHFSGHSLVVTFNDTRLKTQHFSCE